MKLGLISGKLEGTKAISIKSAKSNNNNAKKELKLLDGELDSISYKQPIYNSGGVNKWV